MFSTASCCLQRAASRGTLWSLAAKETHYSGGEEEN